MEELKSRAELLEAMHTLQSDVNGYITGAGDAAVTPAGSEFEAWSMKDLIGHLTAWREMTAARLEAGLQGVEPIAPWPAGLDEDKDIDEINAWIFEANREKSVEEIQQDSDAAFDRVSQAIRAMPEQDLLEPGRFAWMGDHPMGLGPAVVSGTIEHHHVEHGEDLQAKSRG